MNHAATGVVAPQPVRHGRAGGSETYAALDLGTNNCRLLVARPSSDGFRVIDAFSRIVRLGEGLGARGSLSEEAIERSIRALRVCAVKMRRRGVGVARCVATEACRRAANATSFVQRVAEETGVALEVISSNEEARLAVSGCAPLLTGDARHALIFDIGGGSTELTWVRRTSLGGIEVLGVASFPCGVVTLSEVYGGDSYDEATYEAMVAEVERQILPFEKAYGLSQAIAEGGVQMLGTSGTVTTLAGVLMGLPRYDRARVDGTWLDFNHIADICLQLRSLDCEGRAAHPCIGRDRADLVVAGCAVLEAICRNWQVGRVRVADRGVREGILYSLMRGESVAIPTLNGGASYRTH